MVFKSHPQFWFEDEVVADSGRHIIKAITTIFI
jgi:hypothetical protein